MLFDDELDDPERAYFFLSDDAQEEIGGLGKRTIECRWCKHHFRGDILDTCPKCGSLDTEEIIGAPAF